MFGLVNLWVFLRPGNVRFVSWSLKYLWELVRGKWVEECREKKGWSHTLPPFQVREELTRGPWVVKSYGMGTLSWPRLQFNWPSGLSYGFNFVCMSCLYVFVCAAVLWVDPIKVTVRNPNFVGPDLTTYFVLGCKKKWNFETNMCACLSIDTRRCEIHVAWKGCVVVLLIIRACIWGSQSCCNYYVRCFKVCLLILTWCWISSRLTI